MKKQGFAKIRGWFKGKGFIFALALSIAAVGGATYFAYNSVMSSFNEGGENSDELFIGVDKNQAEVPKDTASNSTAASSETTPQASAEAETSSEASESETEAANNFFASEPPRTMPVEGEIVWEYSNGELVKSETLNLWQTHNGIDIAAANGTEVKAPAEGTILNVWEDALWGICVSIDHGDGYVSTLCGLDRSVPVSIGQQVECGDIIAKAGSTADCECELAPHIHFEVKKDGSFIDPKTFAESE